MYAVKSLNQNCREIVRDKVSCPQISMKSCTPSRVRLSRVSAAFVGRFRFSHSRLVNKSEEREVKVFECGVALSSTYYLIFFKISFLVSNLQQP